MLNNQVTCDSTIRQFVYFRGVPDATAFVGIWRQLAQDEFILKHRVVLPPAVIGIHRVSVADPLPVERGDFLGIHYPRDGGRDVAPSGGVVAYSVLADGVVDREYFYQTLVVDAADEDLPTDRTIRLSSFSRQLESRVFAFQATLVPDSLGHCYFTLSLVIPKDCNIFIIGSSFILQSCNCLTELCLTNRIILFSA